MMWVIYTFLSLMFSSIPATQPATSSQPASEDKIIATLDGHNVYAGDIEPPALWQTKNAAKLSPEAYQKWLKQEKNTRLSRIIVKPLMDEYVRENKLEPTKAELEEAANDIRRKMAEDRKNKQDEIKQIQEKLKAEKLSKDEVDQLRDRLETLEKIVNMASQRKNRSNEIKKELQTMLDEQNILQEKLQSPVLTRKEKDKLTHELVELDASISSLQIIAKDDLAESVAEMFVGPWKINKSLYEKYGGMVIHQQLGTEAVGAMQRWLEENEKAGRFAIVDPELRSAFYEYYTRKNHPSIAKDKNPFATPPWLRKEPIKKTVK